VESLTAARKAALSGAEPSDSIRVVNALLTQLDALKARDNVLILTTSNITGAIGAPAALCLAAPDPAADLAFVDRADIKQYIGPPSPAAIYQILASCIVELVRAGIVRPAPVRPRPGPPRAR
jgi:SpoVK/Ycf46/Vps4 family AAA+-type ATPase